MSYVGAKPTDVPIRPENLEPNAFGINLIPDASVTTQKLAFNTGAISGDRNRVINGSCQIVNVATLVAANNTFGYGGPEMFLAANASAGGQFTQSQGSLTFGGIALPTVRQTVNTAVANITANNFWSGITKLFEGFNVFDLRGKPVVVSFVFNTNVSGTYSVALRDSNASQSYVTTITAVANTPTQVSIPIAAIPLAASMPNTNANGLEINIGWLNTQIFQTATLNQWQTGNFISAAGATNWGATAGNFIELTNLQLEEGTVATTYIRRSFGQELALTQRYAWLGTNASFVDNGVPAGAGVRGSASFPSTMRVTPTLQLQQSPSGINFTGPVTLLANSANGFSIQVISAGAGQVVVVEGNGIILAAARL